MLDLIRVDIIPCATCDTGGVFVGVENMTQETFLSYIFSGKTRSLSPIVGDLSTILVNKSGSELLNQVTPSK